MDESKALTTIDRTAFEPRTWADAAPIAEALVRSGMLPAAVKTSHAAMAIMITGRELGLSVMQSFRGIHVIDGKPTMSAQLMMALVLESGKAEYVRCKETTADTCTYETKRKGTEEPERITWQMADAMRADIAGKQNWRKYPAAMLRARACAELLRAVYPDVVMGIYDPYELEPAKTGVSTLKAKIESHVSPEPEAEVVALPGYPPSEAPEDLSELLAEVKSTWGEFEALCDSKAEAKRLAKAAGFSMAGADTRERLLEMHHVLLDLIREYPDQTLPLKLKEEIDTLYQILGDHEAGEMVRKNGINCSGIETGGAIKAKLALAVQLVDAARSKANLEPPDNVELD